MVFGAGKMKPITLKSVRSGLLINHCLLTCWRSVQVNAPFKGWIARLWDPSFI